MDHKEDLLGGRALDDLERGLGDRPGGELWSSSSGGETRAWLGGEQQGRKGKIYEEVIDKAQFPLEEVEMGRDGSEPGDRLKTVCGLGQEWQGNNNSLWIQPLN